VDGSILRYRWQQKPQSVAERGKGNWVRMTKIRKAGTAILTR